MKDIIKDGGPAFPRTGFQASNEDGMAYGHPPQDGMSLRAWLAGMALQGMIASSPVVDRTDPNKINKPRWAAQACGFADALIAELNKNS